MAEGYFVNDQGGEFKLIPQGWVPAICFAMLPMGFHATKWGPKEQIIICFELAHTTDDGKRIVSCKKYNPTLNGDSYLKKDLDTWMSSPLTPEQLKNFNLKNVEGQPAYVCISHKKLDNGKTWPEISVISPMPGNMQALQYSGAQPPDWVLKKQKEGTATAEECQPYQQPQQNQSGFNPPPQHGNGFQQPAQGFQQPANQGQQDHIDEGQGAPAGPVPGGFDTPPQGQSEIAQPTFNPPPASGFDSSDEVPF